VKLPNIVGPASSATVEIKSGLETSGKGKVESRVDVIKAPSCTGRMGIAIPTEGSISVAVLERLSCALMIVSMGNALRHAVSVELQFREDVKAF
jgi:hypothetical protein